MRNSVILMFCFSAIAHADYAAGQRSYQAQNYSNALSEWLPLAEQGDPKSQFAVGSLFASGKGVTQNYSEAVTWWRRAAEQGWAAGQNNLGVSYQFGRGVTQDYSEAVKWYQKAAEQGYTVAQNNLGYQYLKGHGVEQDYVNAEKWFALAGPGKDQEDADARAEVALHLTRDQMANALRLAQEWHPNRNVSQASIDAVAPISTSTPMAPTGATIRWSDKDPNCGQEYTGSVLVKVITRQQVKISVFLGERDVKYELLVIVSNGRTVPVVMNRNAFVIRSGNDSIHPALFLTNQTIAPRKIEDSGLIVFRKAQGKKVVVSIPIAGDTFEFEMTPQRPPTEKATTWGNIAAAAAAAAVGGAKGWSDAAGRTGNGAANQGCGVEPVAVPPVPPVGCKRMVHACSCSGSQCSWVWVCAP